MHTDLDGRRHRFRDPRHLLSLKNGTVAAIAREDDRDAA